ncbi:MAG: glycosyltransferase family 2 protein [Candidatus Gastranaerophilales bacterium]|nr:glycosyltransferase family 2 protein [Candidatus Gastranaerophilales bacterium]
MKERITLLTIIVSLFILLYFFQNNMDTPCALMTILVFMIAYTAYMQIAFKHRVRKQRKHPVEKNYNYKPYVSILIPAHNEAEVIEKTIENISQIDYPLYEIIVIDDRSTDETLKILEKISNKYSNVKYFSRTKEAFPGKSAVLNDALNIAKGDAILIFDADARVKSNFLTELIPALEPHQVGAVQARKVIINREQNFLTRCQDNEMALDTHFQRGRDSVKGAVELRGNGELIKRAALEGVNGWNINTVTDDLDLSTRLQIKGWDVRFCPDVCVYEEGVISYIPLLRQRRRWIEGSIRRYLEHFSDVLTSKDMSLRVSLDMTAYITEFILPVWVVSEILIQSYRFIKDDQNWILSSMALSTLMCVFFFVALYYSLRKYVKLKPKENIIQSLQTCFYMVVLWFPLAIFIIFKIIFMKKDMNWDKTNHGKAKVNDKIVSLNKEEMIKKEEKKAEQLENI